MITVPIFSFCHSRAKTRPTTSAVSYTHLITDRFEFFIGGREIGNGFSELNDAEDQAQRFLDQVAAKDAGDDEAMFYDEDYVTALEHGLDVYKRQLLMCCSPASVRSR